MTTPTLEAADLERLRFPLGRFEPRAGRVTPEGRKETIERIAAAPAALRAAVEGLSDEQLDTPYRPGGWTARQVVHHLADSHINAYVRFKLTITEDRPTIKTYEEARWAEEPDARDDPVEHSLAILDALHRRWTGWLRTLDDAQWVRTLDHPELGSLVLEQMLALYAWHGPHHVAHITRLRERKRW